MYEVHLCDFEGVAVISNRANDGVDIVMLEDAGYRLNVCVVDLENLYAMFVVIGLSTDSVT